MNWAYRCLRCGAAYPVEPGRYLCSACSRLDAPGRPSRGLLECVPPLDKERAAPGSRRASSVRRAPLPVPDAWFPDYPRQPTPLRAPARLRSLVGFPGLWLKDDTVQPSGSLKDRASLLVAAFARRFGIEEVALASTGNAGASMAAVGAAAGLSVTVFLPASAPAAKRVQVLQHGARLREVAGSYDDAYEEALAHCARTGALSRCTGHNPLTIEGKKTVSFEIASELDRAAGGRRAGDQRAAVDHVFVPTGDGAVVSGVLRGFEDLLALGAVPRIPTVWIAQAEGSRALARALLGRAEDDDSAFDLAEKADTLADSIAVDSPRAGFFALAKLRRHGGRAVVVEDEAILDAQRVLSSTAGLFAEPSAACAFAGFLAVRDELDPASNVVVLATGSGLKDIRGAARAVGLEVP